MKWNSAGKFQTSRKGTAQAHLYYFVTQHGTGSQEWEAGFYGYGKQIVMKSAGRFATAQQAREYCEKVDRETLIITAV